MATLRINHVSVNATDLQASVDFYVGLLGARAIPTLDFGFPVQWLEVGDCQLHLFEKPIQPTSHHHCAITVDDLEPVYAFAESAAPSTTAPSATTSSACPGDIAQLYVRDPGGNLLEIDAAGADALPERLARSGGSSRTCTRRAPETMRARLPVGS
jgi:catechol 2,3-dioxygenase-like lactoylglutathione lyase family enzyme